MMKVIVKKESNAYIKSSILSSIVMICLGLLLVLESDTTLISISYVIGAILLLLGGYAILMFFSKKTNELVNQLFIVYGLVSIILGILIIMYPTFIGTVIPFIIGLSFIIKSVSKLKYSIDLKSNNNKYWLITLLFSIVTAICGVILVFNPFTASTIAVQILGGIILVYAVIDLVSSIVLRKNIKKNKKDNIKEADIIEERSEKDE